VPQAFGTAGATAISVPVEETGQSVIGLKAPAAGGWTIQAAPASVPIAGVRTAVELPTVAIKGTVRGSQPPSQEPIDIVRYSAPGVAAAPRVGGASLRLRLRGGPAHGALAPRLDGSSVPRDGAAARRARARAQRPEDGDVADHPEPRPVGPTARRHGAQPVGDRRPGADREGGGAPMSPLKKTALRPITGGAWRIVHS
jgi:hypothetical protein